MTAPTPALLVSKFGPLYRPRWVAEAHALFIGDLPIDVPDNQVRYFRGDLPLDATEDQIDVLSTFGNIVSDRQHSSQTKRSLRP